MPPTPNVQATILCDDVIREAGTGKHSAIGIFTVVNALKFPAAYRFAVYLCLSDAEGSYQLQVDVASLETDKVLQQLKGIRFVSKDRLAISECGIKYLTVVFPKPGKYEVRIYANGEPLSTKPFWVRQVELKKRQGRGPQA